MGPRVLPIIDRNNVCNDHHRLSPQVDKNDIKRKEKNRASSAHGLDNSHITGIHIQWKFTYDGNSSTQLQSLYSLNARPPDLECQKLLDYLVSISHQHCLHHKLPGPINTWETPFQVGTTHTWLTSKCVLGVGNQERKECF